VRPPTPSIAPQFYRTCRQPISGFQPLFCSRAFFRLSGLFLILLLPATWPVLPPQPPACHSVSLENFFLPILWLRPFSRLAILVGPKSIVWFVPSIRSPCPIQSPRLVQNIFLHPYHYIRVHRQFLQMYYPLHENLASFSPKTLGLTFLCFGNLWINFLATPRVKMSALDPCGVFKFDTSPSSSHFPIPLTGSGRPPPSFSCDHPP